MSVKDIYNKNKWIFHTAIVIAVWLFYYMHTPPNWPSLYFEIVSWVIGIAYGVMGSLGSLRSIKNKEDSKILRYLLFIIIGILILTAGIWNAMRH